MLKNRGDSRSYDTYSRHGLGPWDAVFLVRLRQLFAKQPDPIVFADIGTATAAIPIHLAQSYGSKLKIIAVDTDEEMISAGMQRADQLGLSQYIGFTRANAQHLHLKDAAVNVLGCRAVLHHLADPAAALREFYRVLKPGGRAIVHDLRRDADAAAFERFRLARADLSYPETLLEEKLTLAEVHDLVTSLDIAAACRIFSPSRGAGALGFEILISKPN